MRSPQHRLRHALRRRLAQRHKKPSRPSCNLQAAGVAARSTHATKVDSAITFQRRRFFHRVMGGAMSKYSPASQRLYGSGSLKKTCSQSVKSKVSIISSIYRKLQSQQLHARLPVLFNDLHGRAGGLTTDQETVFRLHLLHSFECAPDSAFCLHLYFIAEKMAAGELKRRRGRLGLP